MELYNLPDNKIDDVIQEIRILHDTVTAKEIMDA